MAAWTNPLLPTCSQPVRASHRRTYYTAQQQQQPGGLLEGRLAHCTYRFHSPRRARTHAHTLTHKQQLLEAHSLVLRTLYKRKPLRWQSATARLCQSLPTNSAHRESEGE